MAQLYHDVELTASIETVLAHKHAKRSPYAFRSMVDRLRRAVNEKLDKLATPEELPIQYLDQATEQMLGFLRNEQAADELAQTAELDDDTLKQIRSRFCRMSHIYLLLTTRC